MPGCAAVGAELPGCLVTHTWSSLFLHTVSAIVADALGLDEYEALARQLARRQTAAVRGVLLEQGGLWRRYWVCAFCVNQHSSICHSLGHAPPSGTPEHDRWMAGICDSVTGEMLPTCVCAQPKYLNAFPEECEMNKFDDMMALMKERADGFYQLVAVDRGMTVFTRLWCIAELVQASRSNIPQRVCLESSGVLSLDGDDHRVYKRLATLRVSECSASRAEDKEEILKKIPDRAEFDAQLQTLIFGDRGLLQERFVGFDILAAGARSARRVCLAAGVLEDA